MSTNSVTTCTLDHRNYDSVFFFSRQDDKEPKMMFKNFTTKLYKIIFFLLSKVSNRMTKNMKGYLNIFQKILHVF